MTRISYSSIKLLLWVWGNKAAASQLGKCGTAVVVVEGKPYLLNASDHPRCEYIKIYWLWTMVTKCALLQYLITTGTMTNFRWRCRRSMSLCPTRRRRTHELCYISVMLSSLDTSQLWWAHLTPTYSLSSYTMLTPSHSPLTSILDLGNIVKL